MAPTEQALTKKVEEGSQYQLEPKQVIRAATALIKHIKTTETEKEAQSLKQNLLADADNSDDEAGDAETPVWLLVTTKRHVVDKQRLKPGKIALPHSLNTSSDTKICLITADPQRRYKDIVAHASFPVEVSKHIGRVIGLSKLKAKYKSYESRRQLASEYDVFFADDRIITSLPQLLGKVFYKSSSKRPVPVSLIGAERKTKDADGKKKKQTGDERTGSLSSDAVFASRDIERALSSALIHLSPSTSVSVKVGLASWTPEKLRENIEALTTAVIDKYVPQKWNNVRSIHIKGPHTTALPIWLAEELWVDEADITDKKIEPPTKAQRREKRMIRDAARAVTAPDNTKLEEWDEVGEDGVIERKKRKRMEVEEFAKELAERKAKAKKQRQKVMGEAGGVSLLEAA